MRIRKLNSVLSEAKVKKKMYKGQLKEHKSEKAQKEKDLVNAKKARALLQEVAQQTQKMLEYSVENLVTLALKSVFPDPYKFKVEFEQKRNKTECALLFEKDSGYLKPLESSGGGPIDVASLALRMTFWRISTSDPVMVLDEPLKFVSADYRDLCGYMLKELSEKLEVQIIMVTHLPELLPYANKTIDIEEAK